MNQFIIDPRYKVLRQNYSEIDLWGGRARGASFTATAWFVRKLIQGKYFRGYMMRFILSDVRNSLWRDLLDRIEELGLDQNRFHINDGQMTITDLETGNMIFSKGFRKSQGSSTAKLKSIAGATDVLIEECEEIPESDYMKLKDSLRTVKGKLQILRLWNPPPKSHWLIKNYFNLIPTEYEDFFKASPKEISGYCAVYSNYIDNIKNLNEDTVRRFEAYEQTHPEHYLTDILGLVPSGAKGRVFKKYKTYKELPNEDFYKVFGLDFGYSNDPTALIELNFNRKQRRLYIFEHLYQKGMHINEIANHIKKVNAKNSEVVCDSAEPREIDELIMYGLNAMRATKQKGSIEEGITTIKSYEVFIHDRSVNVLSEFENYKYSLDSNGAPTNQPEDNNNHAVDAIRYGSTYYNRNFSFNYKNYDTNKD